MEYFELKKYSFFPDMKKMQKIKGDNWEYIALAFEIAIPQDKKALKMANFYVVGYLYVDYCDGSANINFDIPTPESCGELFYGAYKVSKAVQTKTLKVEDNRYDVKLKLNNSSAHYSGELSEVISKFLLKTAIPDIADIVKFLGDNHISYEKELVQNFISKFSSFVLEQFSPQNLEKSLGADYKKLDSQMVFNKLLEETQEKPKNKLLKI